MFEGTGLSPITDPGRDPGRGDPREDVSDGAGSRDLAVWTRSSSFCILPIRPRIWYRDPDFGRPDGRWEVILDMLLRVETEGVDRPLL